MFSNIMMNEKMMCGGCKYVVRRLCGCKRSSKTLRRSSDMDVESTPAAAVAEASLPKLMGELWDSFQAFAKFKKVETSFYRHMGDCAGAHPFRPTAQIGHDDWESVVLALRDCRGLMKEAYDDMRKAKKDKDEVNTFTVRKLLDLHVFYGWQLSIDVMLTRGERELDHLAHTIFEVIQATSQEENPPLKMIQKGLAVVTEGEQYFKVALIWSQVSV